MSRGSRWGFAASAAFALGCITPVMREFMAAAPYGYEIIWELIRMIPDDPAVLPFCFAYCSRLSAR